MLNHEEQEFVADIDGVKTVVKIVLDQGCLVISWDAPLTPVQVLQLINEAIVRIAVMILNQLLQPDVSTKQLRTQQKLRC